MSNCQHGQKRKKRKAVVNKMSLFNILLISSKAITDTGIL